MSRHAVAGLRVECRVRASGPRGLHDMLGEVGILPPNGWDMLQQLFGALTRTRRSTVGVPDGERRGGVTKWYNYAGQPDVSGCSTAVISQRLPR